MIQFQLMIEDICMSGFEITLKNDLMKARPAVCSPVNQRAKSTAAVWTISHKYSYFCLSDLSKIILEKLSEVCAGGNFLLIPGNQWGFSVKVY